MDALRARATAYRDVVDTDAGGEAKPGSRNSEEKSGEIMGAMMKRIHHMQQEPMKILERMSQKSTEMYLPHGAESQVAPTYLVHIYAKNRYCVDYFKDMMTAKGLTGKPLDKELRRLAAGIDDA